MSNVLPFSQALRERTSSGHGNAENSGFMHDLLSGKGSRQDYIALVGQQYFIYQALESVAKVMESDELARLFITPKLTRLPAIEADLRFLIGDDWAERIHPLPATMRYVDRLNTVAHSWNGGFIAHHYTRYMGDLSGGQIIRTLIQRQFGFETNGVGFYVFDEIAKPKVFKDTYREQLDATGWTEEEQNRVIEEVMIAYRLNAEVFDDLQTAKSSSVA